MLEKLDPRIDPTCTETVFVMFWWRRCPVTPGVGLSGFLCRSGDRLSKETDFAKGNLFFQHGFFVIYGILKA